MFGQKKKGKEVCGMEANKKKLNLHACRCRPLQRSSNSMSINYKEDERHKERKKNRKQFNNGIYSNHTNIGKMKWELGIALK